MDAAFASFREDVVRGFFEKTEEAEAHREGENNASTCIQSHYRGFVVRKGIKHLKDCAIVVQKYVRAYFARKLFYHMEQEHVKSLRRAYFNQNATVIQKWFRGFLCRKYKHNFYARKAYIEHVTMKANDLVEELRGNHGRLAEEHHKLEGEAAQKR